MAPPKALALSMILALTLLSTAAHAQGRTAGENLATMPVIEFYNAAQDHYFISAATQEIADLDAGIHPGWQRTGLSFNAYPVQVTGSSPVCRFYIPPAFGDSHFYSASPEECAQTQAKFPGFVYESSSVFYIALPDTTSGACPSDTIPVYRVWDNRADTNHRYTTNPAVRLQMKDHGWIAEGYGDDQVIMCSPLVTSIAMVDYAIAGQSVTKVRSAGNVVALLEERLVSIFEQGPQRTLALLQADGRTVSPYTPPEGWSVVDFAVHPSGDVSAILTTNTAVRIVRLGRDGAVRTDQPFLDPAARSDPYLDLDGGIKDDEALQPFLMRDAARVAPLGESLAVVLRTGRNAVVAYRLDQEGGHAYRTAWRTLVEPGTSIFGLGIESGTFDVFGQLDNHVRVHVDVDATGTLAIGVVDAAFLNHAFQAHTKYFGEPIGAPVGVLLTRIASSDGRRLGTTVIDTRERAELHAVRATPRGFALVGRVRSEIRPDGTGWNAFTAFVASDGTAGAYSVLDIDRGDVLFDIAELPSGRYLAPGTTGYVQNPAGASISEDTQPLLALLNVDGALIQRLGFSGGARQNQLNTIASLNGRWLIGGMRNGPGTHSGDVQRELIAADGFLREVFDLPAAATKDRTDPRRDGESVASSGRTATAKGVAP